MTDNDLAMLDTIAAKRGPGRPPKPKMLPVKLLKNYWSEDGGRHKKGAEIELPADEAREVVAKLIGERNDPF